MRRKKDNTNGKSVLAEYFDVEPTRKEKISKISNQFLASLGYELDLKNPRTFNEKLQWLKIYYRNDLMSVCADKYRVREYVRKTIGDQYLVPLLGVYDRVEDIDFDLLPDRFVLKVNHGSGQNIICRAKEELNVEDAKRKLREWIRPESNHYFYSYEWCYKDIVPKIIAEKYIFSNDESGLVDYKFLCFGNNCGISFTCSERSSGKLKVDFFDKDWRHLPFTRYYPNAKDIPSKPKNFDEMKKLAEKLSSPFPFVRVDFYEVGSKLYFSELTFYPGNGMEGFTPEEWDRKLGDLLILPNKEVSIYD